MDIARRAERFDSEAVSVELEVACDYRGPDRLRLWAGACNTCLYVTSLFLEPRAESSDLFTTPLLSLFFALNKYSGHLYALSVQRCSCQQAAQAAKAWIPGSQ
eukprot:1115413-Amphidinium_carterae.1